MITINLSQYRNFKILFKSSSIHTSVYIAFG